MNSNIVYMLLVINIVVISAENFVENEEKDKFIPSNEWQVIKEGQSIPKGLHVRINLETGLKEAKLLEPDQENKRSSALLEVKQDEEVNDNADQNENVYSSDELKKVLEKIKNDENLPSIPEEEINRVTNKFKDYEQLKKELGDINVSVKSDAELLLELTNNYKLINNDKTISGQTKNDEIFKILQDIEYLVHQIDNANDFISGGSFTEIIYQNLNNTDAKIKSEALKILGSCVQNNAKVQIHALETGAVETITRLLSLETNVDVKLRAIYSLSGLLRRFPLAQKQFIKDGGLNIFAKIFMKPDHMKLQLKVITLIYDLLIEQKEAIGDIDHVNFKERNKQYKAVNLEKTLIENGWCEIFNNILINNLSIEDIDHDAVERCLNIILLVVDNCKEEFSNIKLLKRLEELKRNYQILEKDENLVDPYYSHLKDLTHNLITIIVHNYKTEL